MNIVREEFPVRDWSIEYDKLKITCELSDDVEEKFRRTWRNLKEAGYLLSLSRESERGIQGGGIRARPKRIKRLTT